MLPTLGGSTNLFLHLLALAHESNVDLSVHDFQRIGERVPLLGNLSPHGAYHMSDLNDIGGIPLVMKELSRGGFLHEDVMTVTGKTLAENLKSIPTLAEVASQKVIFPLEKPYAEPGNHIGVLTGNCEKVQ